MKTLMALIRKLSSGFSLEIYIDKFAESGRRLFTRAYEEARSRDHNQLAPEHILLSITKIERPLFDKIMQSLNLDTEAVLDALEARLARNDYPGKGIKMSESVKTLLSNALRHARRKGRRAIESTDLFIALFKDEGSFPVDLLKRLGVERNRVVRLIDKLT
ncbi:MAG: hypothetical protein L0229_10080 [Blastocatellia bacterium]|nr:hypothetical protein [Blastocatellia bacterium]